MWPPPLKFEWKATLPGMGPRRQGPGSTPKKWHYSSHSSASTVFFSVQSEKKFKYAVGRNVSSHLFNAWLICCFPSCLILCNVDMAVRKAIPFVVTKLYNVIYSANTQLYISIVILYIHSGHIMGTCFDRKRSSSGQ